MSVRIIIDSAADFEPELAEAHGITVIPMKTIFGEKEYAEAVDITREEFYEMLLASDEFPRTSQIPPFEFKGVFEGIDPQDEAVVITLSSKISGTYESACAAAAEFAGRVIVVDSESATFGERLLVERAVALRNEGLNARGIAEILNAEKKSIRLIAVLDTLEYLKKGGRISAAAAAIGGALSIKPVVGVVDGEVAVLGKARGSKQGNNLLRKKIGETAVDFSRPVHLGYSHGGKELLERYVDDSRDLFEGFRNELPASIVGSTIGSHIGPGAFGVAYFEKSE